MTDEDSHAEFIDKTGIVVVQNDTRSTVIFTQFVNNFRQTNCRVAITIHGTIIIQITAATCRFIKREAIIRLEALGSCATLVGFNGPIRIAVVNKTGSKRIEWASGGQEAPARGPRRADASREPHAPRGGAARRGGYVRAIPGRQLMSAAAPGRKHHATPTSAEQSSARVPHQLVSIHASFVESYHEVNTKRRCPNAETLSRHESPDYGRRGDYACAVTPIQPMPPRGELLK
ncbi:hypothetical protein EVAR_53367_1 [Eumeta japonica]|uniref:Uncharacterized protein n=1 Tax=Eumeta variegata TaxID=151549 RepID=A0A4C1Y986_EUMVA|nr:hypothetical protein EVAR_53367_1 [Eumeta japonica]